MTVGGRPILNRHSVLRLLWWNVSWEHSAETDQQIEAVRSLDPPPDVVALSEVDEYRENQWRNALEADLTFVDPPRDLPRRKLRVLLGCTSLVSSLPLDQFPGVRPQAMRSARVRVGEREVDVHAVHIPNGTSNGWMKIDHLWGVRVGLEPPRPRPAVLCGDFNTPWLERQGALITAAQDENGQLRSRPRSRRAKYSPERPWNAAAWDAGERAVLEGLPRDCGMADVFLSSRCEDAPETWTHKRNPNAHGRRLDHVFASSELKPVLFRHIHSWRHRGLSDHSAIEAGFQRKRVALAPPS